MYREEISHFLKREAQERLAFDGCTDDAIADLYRGLADSYATHAQIRREAAREFRLAVV